MRAQAPPFSQTGDIQDASNRATLPGGHVPPASPNHECLTNTSRPLTPGRAEKGKMCESAVFSLRVSGR